MSQLSKEQQEFLDALDRLTTDQRQFVQNSIHAFTSEHMFWRASDSDVITDAVLASLGDRLLTHHASSRQALSKDRFEFAFESALNAAGVPARLVTSRTNRGHDIDINGVPVSLKTEAAANIREDFIHVSKWMELGRGEWDLPVLRDLFLDHMQGYHRIFTMRKLKDDGGRTRYELVEIPKTLLLEAAYCDFEVCENSRQNPMPGYGYVKGLSGDLKFSLYFDGGGERKLQIKHLRKDLCKLHATWSFVALAQT